MIRPYYSSFLFHSLPFASYRPFSFSALLSLLSLFPLLVERLAKVNVWYEEANDVLAYVLKFLVKHQNPLAPTKDVLSAIFRLPFLENTTIRRQKSSLRTSSIFISSLLKLWQLLTWKEEQLSSRKGGTAC